MRKAVVTVSVALFCGELLLPNKSLMQDGALPLIGSFYSVAYAAESAEGEHFKIDVDKFFPQYRTVPNELILRADITRGTSSTETKLLGAASGALKCLFSDPSNKECYQASVSLSTNTELSADEIVSTLQDGFTDNDERLQALQEYMGRLDDKGADLIRAANRAHIDLSRNLSYLKDLTASGDATAFELYKKATDFKVNLELLRANLERYKYSVQQSTSAMHTLLQGQKASQSSAGKDCEKQLNHYTFRVERLAEITDVYQREYDLLHLASMTQKVREDEGYTPNFLYFLLNKVESSASDLARKFGGNDDAAADLMQEKKGEALSLEQLQAQLRRFQEQNEQLGQMSSVDREQFQALKAEFSQLQADSVDLQKQLAYYEAAMQLQSNQIKENQKLLEQLQVQKNQLQSSESSLTASEKQQLQEYEQYIKQLEGEIETMRQSYLEYADYRNVLNIEVQ